MRKRYEQLLLKLCVPLNIWEALVYAVRKDNTHHCVLVIFACFHEYEVQMMKANTCAWRQRMDERLLWQCILSRSGHFRDAFMIQIKKRMSQACISGSIVKLQTVPLANGSSEKRSPDPLVLPRFPKINRKCEIRMHAAFSKAITNWIEYSLLLYVKACLPHTTKKRRDVVTMIPHRAVVY